MTTKLGGRPRNKAQQVSLKRDDAQVSAEEAQPKPKTGPGQHFRREMINPVGAGKPVKRFKNIAVTPLIAAKERGQLLGPGEGETVANERFDHAQKFEGWWIALHGTGSSRDSTIQRVGGGQGRTFSEQHDTAKRKIAMLRECMGGRNYLIVEAFCGEGHTMVEALRHAGVQVHPVGTAFRVREALDDLVCVLTGRLPVPIVVPA